MIKKSVTLNVVAYASLLVCSAAQAAVAEDSAAPVVHWGGISVYPGLAIVEKSDSNIARLPDTDPAKRSAVITILSPSVLFQAENAADTYSLAYSADLGRYSNSSPDNYVDQKFLGLAELGLSASANLSIQPEYQYGHDDRGSTFGALTSEPNVWKSTGLSGTFSYGAEEARGHAVLDLGYTDRQYQNNRTLTIAYDKKLTSVGGTFYFLVQPKTSLLVSAKNTGISYKQTSSNLNGNEQRVRVGVKWEATAQTSGEIQVGQVQKKFDSTLPTYTGGSWEGAVRWSPVSYVNVDLTSSRAPSESTLATSSTILVSNSGMNVAYDLNDRVTLSANGYQLKEDFVGASRVDHTNTAGLKAEYKFRSWLVGGAEYSNSAKSSSNPLNDYKRNVFMISVRSVL